MAKSTIDIEIESTGGSFTITAFGQTSEPISHDAPQEEVEKAIDRLAEKAKSGGELDTGAN